MAGGSEPARASRTVQAAPSCDPWRVQSTGALPDGLAQRRYCVTKAGAGKAMETVVTSADRIVPSNSKSSGGGSTDAGGMAPRPTRVLPAQRTERASRRPCLSARTAARAPPTSPQAAGSAVDDTAPPASASRTTAPLLLANRRDASCRPVPASRRDTSEAGEAPGRGEGAWISNSALQSCWLQEKPVSSLE